MEPDRQRRQREADQLSGVYPVARGVAPLLVAFAAPFAAGEHLNALGFAGVLLATMGIVWVGLSDVLPGFPRRSFSGGG